MFKKISHYLKARSKPLPQKATSLSIPISVLGSDPLGPGGAAASGVKEYDLYVAIDTGAFNKFATIPASNPNTVYLATSNHTYFFRSVARDFAGNVEIEPANLPDATIRVNDLDPPETQVVSAVTNPLGQFTLTLSGSERGGSSLSRFDLYVSIDGAPAAYAGSAVAGAAGVGGVHQVTMVYQGLADGLSHTYRFSTRGADTAGNLEPLPVVADLIQTHTFASPGVVATSIDVQQGANQRSFIQYVDLSFANTHQLGSVVLGKPREVGEVCDQCQQCDGGNGGSAVGLWSDESG